MFQGIEFLIHLRGLILLGVTVMISRVRDLQVSEIPRFRDSKIQNDSKVPKFYIAVLATRV